MTAPVLAVDDLRTTIETDSGKVVAVDGVSLSLREGDTIGVVGESGSGKTMLARSIMRLQPKAATVTGSVTFRGGELTHIPAAAVRPHWGRDIAMVLQNPMTALNPVWRVGRQVAEPLRLHLGLSRSDARARSTELLRLVGIADPVHRARAFPHQLSGGMRQRVCIAIAIACTPAVLIADEPTTALDVTIQRQILDLVSDLQDQNRMALVLITHDLGITARRTNRVVVMYGGVIVESGRTSDVFDTPRHPYTAALLAAIPRLSGSSGERLEAIPGRPATRSQQQIGCRFAARCRYAQQRCLEEEPASVSAIDDEHGWACFFPVGTDAGDRALEINRRSGRTAAGRELVPDEVEP